MQLDPIVTLDEIRDRLDQFVVCDVRWYLDGRSGAAAYLEGHIPGAVFVELDHDLSAPELAPARGRHPWPTAEAFVRRLGELGISRADPVLAYDDNGGAAGAGRMVWMLRALGHDAALLDGGIAAWEGDLESTPNEREPVSYPQTAWPTAELVRADDVAATAAAGQLSVFDVRSPDRFRGDSEPVDPRAGHIPGATNLPLSGNTDDAGYFLPKRALAQRFAAAGVDGNGSAIVYCGSGVSACQTLLAMEHAGVGRHQLYPGSWSEWSRDPTRPAASGD